MSRILLLLVCIYMCNARPLRLNHIDFGGGIQLSSKITLIEGKKDVVDEEKVTLLSSLSSQGMEGKDGDALGRHNEGNKGNILPLASQETTILETPEVKEKRKHARLLRSKPGNNTKENVDPKEDGKEEDTVVMDYAHPHRKPPIHNMTP